MRALDSNAGSWEKRSSLMPRLAIVGLGYVGLPLALAFARRGCPVVGLDVDAAKIEKLNAGQGYLQHVDSSDLSVLVGAGTFRASVDFAEVCGCDAAIICVPTPLDRHREPDLSYVLDTGRALARHLPKGILVVLESTTYPGTTDEDLRRVLEEGSGLKAGTDFHLAFSPEREDPGNPQSKVADIPKVVGGYTPACLEKAVAIYSLAVSKVVPVSSCRAAEATKLLENIFRAVNIALINELKVVYGAMDIDIWEVIEAAKTKPFGFMPFYPGPGLGGHCIPIDPFYLTWKAREFGQHTRFIELAGEINTAMPRYVVEKVGEALNKKKRPLTHFFDLFLSFPPTPNSLSFHPSNLSSRRRSRKRPCSRRSPRQRTARPKQLLLLLLPLLLLCSPSRRSRRQAPPPPPPPLPPLLRSRPRPRPRRSPPSPPRACSSTASSSTPRAS